MVTIPGDPFDGGGIEEFGARLRNSQTTCEATTEAFLKRISVLDPKIGAFQYLAADQALECARAVDGMLAAGVDLGALMGVPVAL